MTAAPEQTALAQAKQTKTSQASKPPTKKSLLIKLLSRKSGIDLQTISAKLGWQPHTTRAALSELRKAGLDVTKETGGIGKPTRYRILPASTQNDAGARDVE